MGGKQTHIQPVDLTKNRIIRTIHKTKPNMVRRVSRRENSGKVSKLPLHQWFLHIFRYNETEKEKLTDLDIVNSMAAEFSRRLATVRLLLSTPGKLGTERARYNNLQKHCLLSLRYNERQFPISGSGSAAMSLSEIREKCFYYKKIDPRFFTEEEIVWMETQRENGVEEYLACSFPTEEEKQLFPFGSQVLGVPDDDPTPIEILEIEWMNATKKKKK